MQDFFQTAPVLSNQYTSDKLLVSYLNRVIPKEFLAEILDELNNLGEKVTSEILEMAYDVDANPPKLVPYDPWGKKIDKIVVSQGWKDLEKVSAEEGLISIGYKRKHQEYSRIHQFAKLYLFNPSSSVYTCPLAMTDGGAKLIEEYGDDYLKNTVYNHITSNDPKEFWTSGQWMTEKTGGSDVSNTMTVAKLENGTYKLYGTKWFTSATTSQVAFTLARIEDEHGNKIEGSRGLSLFYVKIRDEQGNLNNIAIHRLKDKLGTKGVPTAELTLNGTEAMLVGGVGGGVKKISSLFNITRIYNATTAVAFMRRCLALIKDYSKKRFAFKKFLSEHSLHLETLADLEVEFQAAFHLLFYTVALLGKEDCNKATENEKAVLRILTPLLKLYTAKQAISLVSEVLEGFGGAGYVEDTGLPKFLRDTQVLSIWEGTTNILSLDVLRSMEKEKTIEPFFKDLDTRLESIKQDSLKASTQKVKDSVTKIKKFLYEASKKDSDFVEASARSLSYSLSRTFCASLLLEHAEYTLITQNSDDFVLPAIRWCEKDLAPLIYPDEKHRLESKKLALF